MSHDPQSPTDAADFYDDDNEYDVDEEEDDGADECGRWMNGRLSPQFLKAGSEECDWDCPIGLSRKTWP